MVVTSKRLEIERRLVLFQANRPKKIARELGVSAGYVHEVGWKMKEKNKQSSTNKNPGHKR